MRLQSNGNGELLVFAAGEYGSELVKVPAVVGKEFTTALNWKYLDQALSAYEKGSLVVMSTNDPISPVLFRGSLIDSIVLMPMFVTAMSPDVAITRASKDAEALRKEATEKQHGEEERDYRGRPNCLCGENFSRKEDLKYHLDRMARGAQIKGNPKRNPKHNPSGTRCPNTECGQILTGISGPGEYRCDACKCEFGVRG